MIVIADASPLIFLAKVRRLDLIPALLGQDIRVPKSVADEVVALGTDPVEAEVLNAFLRQCRIETVELPRRFASAMSQADNEVLTSAIRIGAEWLLCDDRVTRRMAETEGIRPLGTLGILLRCMHQKLIVPGETRTLVNRLVESHNFRVGIAVYQAILKEIQRAE